MAPYPLLQKWLSTSPRTIAHYNSTLQWHLIHSRNGTQQWYVHSPKIGRYPSPNLEWHPAIPSYGTTFTPPKLVVSLPYHHSTLGTQQWHHIHSVITIPPNHSTLQQQIAIAPRNGTTSTAPCNGTLLPHPIHQSGSLPSPPIGSKNSLSYRYLENNIISKI